MNVEQICREVSIILQKLEKTDTTDKNFNFDVDLFDYGYLDSFGVVELLFEIKQVFGLDLYHEDFYHDLRSVRSISAYILTKVGKSETNT